MKYFMNTFSADPSSTPSMPTTWLGVATDVFLTLQKATIPS